MDEKPRSLLLSILLLPIALALMAPLVVLLLLWYYVSALAQGVWMLLRRCVSGKSSRTTAVQPPHFGKVISKRVTTDVQ